MASEQGRLERESMVLAPFPHSSLAHPPRLQAQQGKGGSAWEQKPRFPVSNWGFRDHAAESHKSHNAEPTEPVASKFDDIQMRARRSVDLREGDSDEISSRW